MVELRDRVLEIVKREGPMLPVAIARKVERDILFASAVLSELISRKEVMLTKGKIGGSPLYYVRGQEQRLQTLYSHMGERPQKAFSLLKEKKVLQDRKCEPWQRVALREIQDFAKPLEVRMGDNSEVFWRWYLVGKEETEKLVKEILDGNNLTEELVPEPLTTESLLEYEEKTEVKEEKPIQEFKEELKEEKKVEVPEKRPEPKKEIEKSKELKKSDDTSLTTDVGNYFNKNRIEVLGETVVRKNSEIDYFVKIPSEIGTLDYFVKVKSKKRVNEGDLSLARDRGRDHKLPVLFLPKGDMTKKAKEYLDKNLKGYLIFRKLN